MNDTAIFLVLAGIAMVFKWLNRERTDQTLKPPPPRSAAPIPRAPAQSEEEKIRRFVEALGAPPGSRPPPALRPRPMATARREIAPRTPPPARKPPTRPKRSWAQPLPPLVTTPPEEIQLPPLVTVPTPLAPEILPVEPPRPIVRQQMPGRVLASAPARSLSLGEMLRSAGSARQAMILREVLGPPRGVQAIDLASSRPL